MAPSKLHSSQTDISQHAGVFVEERDNAGVTSSIVWTSSRKLRVLTIKKRHWIKWCLNYSYIELFVPWTCPGWTVYRVRFVRWTFHPLDILYDGLFVPQTFRSMGLFIQYKYSIYHKGELARYSN